MINILSLAFGIIGIFVTLFVFYAGINRKLKEIIEKDRGILTLSQTQVLVNLYIDYIQKEFHIKVQEFIDLKYEEIVQQKDNEGVIRFIFHTANDVIENTRSKVSLFRIKGGQNFRELIEQVNPINDGLIQKAKEKSLKEFNDAIHKGIDRNTLKNTLYNIVERAGRQSYDKIREELLKRY